MKLSRFLKAVILSLGTVLTASAQDVLITQEGNAHKVYEIEIGGSSIFYKLENTPEATIQKMDKSQVLMIKYQDGRKVIMGEEEKEGKATFSSQKSTDNQPTPLSEEMRKKNEEWIKQYNASAMPTLKKEDKPKQADMLHCTMGFKKESILFTDDLEVQIQSGIWTYKNSGAPKNFILYSEDGTSDWDPTILITLKNVSDRTLFIDMGNSFITRNGKSEPLYVPSSTTTSSSKSGGVGVNLGAVADVLGVGGVVGTLANGVNVGGGTTSGTSTVTYSQRVIAIPPKSTKQLDYMSFFKIGETTAFFEAKKLNKYSHSIHSRKNIKRGESQQWGEEDSPFQLSFFFTYSFEESCKTNQTIHTQLYLKEILGCKSLSFDMFNCPQENIIAFGTWNKKEKK